MKEIFRAEEDKILDSSGLDLQWGDLSDISNVGRISIYTNKAIHRHYVFMEYNTW